MPEITMNEYQQKAQETAIYAESIAKITRDRQSQDLLRLAYVALGLGEVGELQGKIKKLIRDGNIEHFDNRHAIAKELGDILWYVAMAATEFGFTLDEVAKMNVEKLASRKERGKLQGSGDER